MNQIEPGSNTTIPNAQQQRNRFPPGLVGDVAFFLYVHAPHPNDEIALAGAIGILSGICGQRFNSPTGAGLNQYICILAHTGRGKGIVAKGASTLFKAIAGSISGSEDGVRSAALFYGPSHIASAEALLKQLGKSPCFFCIQGEIAAWIKLLTAPHASANHVGLKRTILDIYDKSGEGNSIGSMIYSDTAKNTETVISPAFTIIGESTFDLFDGLDEAAISSGMLPRFLTFKTEADRPYLSDSVGTPPDSALVKNMSNLISYCAAYKPGAAIKVAWDDDAKARFNEFGNQATDYINSNKGSAHAELWNRAYLKALKVASLGAVGENIYSPTITLPIANYAIALIANQTNWLADKFERGENGVVAGDEIKQETLVVNEIGDLVTRPYDNDSDLKFGLTYEMHRDGIIPQTYLSRKLLKKAPFRDKYKGGTDALRRVLKSLVDSDELGEVPKLQMKANYGASPRSFVVINPTRFIKPCT